MATGAQAEQSSARVRCIYSAAAANRSSQIADWAYIGDGSSALARDDDDGTELIYASHRNVAIAPSITSRHPKPVQLIATPYGQLTVLKLAHHSNGHGRPRIVAASDDGWIYIFSRNDAKAKWEEASSWHVKSSGARSKQASSLQETRRRPGIPETKKASKEPAISVRALGVFRQTWQADASQGDCEDEGTIIATATSDGEMQIWQLDSSSRQADLLQRIELGRTRAETRTEVLPLDIVLAPLVGSPEAVLLVAAGTDSKISLYLAEDGKEFRKLFSISGHTDWVRSLDICLASPPESKMPILMLSSGAQDNHIRLWRLEGTIEETLPDSQDISSNAHVDDFDKLASEIEDSNASEAIATKSQTFRCGNMRWSVSLDALLTGHEHWVSGVRWCPPSSSKGTTRAAALLSSSADNSIILWTPSSGLTDAVSGLSFSSFDRSAERDSQEENIWVPVQRFGELGNTGSAANGMYGVVWHPQAQMEASHRQAVVGHGYGGAIHVWARERDSQGHIGPWQARPGRGGHFASANAVRWEPSGAYLISGGSDKTTRLHGSLCDQGASSWHEMARPQTHGYEIVGLGWLSRLAFASAGDEKTIRVFEAPTGFVESARNLGMTKAFKRKNMLVIEIASMHEMQNPTAFAKPIKEATRRSIEGGGLDICISSPFFDGVSAAQAPQLSFKQAEHFLKWCYAMSWGIAVEASELLFDIDILVGGRNIVDNTLLDGAYDTVFTIEGQLAARTASTILQTGTRDDDGLPVDSDLSVFDQRDAVAMGGTFDHLHVGHKILLSMACLLSCRRIVVGVTDDSMLTKKKEAQLLEPIEDRIKRVSGFMSRFSRLLGRPLQYDVVKLQDVAGPAGTDGDLKALLFTDETLSGADFIDGVRERNGLQKLDRFFIGVIGASGETDVKGKDASELAAAKVGSTAIRQWLAKEQGSTKASDIETDLAKIATLTGEARPIGASVPPLGLSNRAIFGEASAQGSAAEPRDAPSESGQPVGKATRSIATQLSRPPVEEELHNHSIWTEVTKLYGHSLELLAIDVDRVNGIVASSCKANHEELAGVRLHDSRNGWKEVQVLMGHSLGVTRIRFDESGTHLLTVSRDRSWRLYARRDSEAGFHQCSVGEEAHSRIIYDVAWCGSSHFATASRDGSFKLWTIAEDDESVEMMQSTSLRTPLSAIAADAHRGWLAIGAETGTIFIFKQNKRTDTGEASTGWQQALVLPHVHADTITELAWRPRPSTSTTSNSNVLASSGKDGAVRLIEIAF